MYPNANDTPMSYSNTMLRLKKSSIRVTDIASQYWCEKQMELSSIHGWPFTKAMKAGKEIHAQLQEKAFDHVAAKPLTFADSFYKIALEDILCIKRLNETGMCREFRIYGSINGYKIAGSIDQMELDGGKVKIIEHKTVQKRNSLDEVSTRPHRVQALVYKKLLDDIINREYTFANFSASYGVDRLFMSEEFMKELEKSGGQRKEMTNTYAWKKMFEEAAALKGTSEDITVRYLDKATGEVIENLEVRYSKEETDRYITNAMKYWNGQREAMPVVESENWKCNSCRFFGKECKVWWKDGT